MTKQELIKELEELRDIKNYSQSELMNTGYKTAISDALDLVNKYFVLAPVSDLLCGTCTDFKIVGKMFVCKKCGKEQKSISA
jgi:hypothetical protein